MKRCFCEYILSDSFYQACSNPTKCRFCPKKFDNKRKLYAHQHTHVAHKKPKPSKLNCTVCHKPFTKMEMNLHMETHVKVVKKGFTFRCIKCRAAYNSHLDLIQHMNDDHPNKNKKSKVVNWRINKYHYWLDTKSSFTWWVKNKFKFFHDDFII